jgi:hypothetical protein
VLVAQNIAAGLRIGQETNRNGHGEQMDLEYTVAAVQDVLA